MPLLQHLKPFLLLVPGNKVFITGKLRIQMIPDCLLLFLFLFRRHNLLIPALQSELIVDDGTFQPFHFLHQYIHFNAVEKILVHFVFSDALFHLPVKAFDFLQPSHPQFDLIQGVLQILIGPHIFPQNIDVHLFFVQNIGINEIFDIINGPKCHRLGNQPEKFIFQPAEAVLDHLLCILLRGAPGLDLLSIARTELGNGFRNFSLKK